MSWLSDIFSSGADLAKDKAKDAFSWTDLIVPAFQAGTSLLGGTMGLSAQKDKEQQSEEERERDRMLNLQLEALRARYGSGGGGGGGGLTEAQKLAARQGSADHNLQAITNLIAAYQSALK